MDDEAYDTNKLPKRLFDTPTPTPPPSKKGKGMGSGGIAIVPPRKTPVKTHARRLQGRANGYTLPKVICS